MSVHNLDALFQPRSVAVVGASNRPRSVGAVVVRNLLRGGFEGPVMPVTPKYGAVAGVLAYPKVGALPQTPDLAVVCTPAETVPDLVAELGRRGTRAAVVLSAGFSESSEAKGRGASRRMLEAARPHGLRILGPNCLGLLVPGLGLDASFAHVAAHPGHLAFVSQSGALCTAVLDWACSRSIGFSHFVSLGNSADVDAGDVLDYLGSDPATRAILLYLEAVHDGRKFLSAGRAAARNKPVLVIKSGRDAAGARAAASHTGALAGSDAVYEAAFRRAGMLRVHATTELFGAAETLERARPLLGERLAVLTNGGGPGVMAVDALAPGGNLVAELSAETVAQLDAVLPPTWSKANPVDLIGDAPGERYAGATRILLEAPEVDALLILNAPTAIASSLEAARAVVEAVGGSKSRRTVLTSWLGGEGAQPARRVLRDAGLPTYDTPEEAVRAYRHMVSYRRSQELLIETPPSIPAEFEPDTAAARGVIRAALAQGRELLTEPEAQAVLAAYGVPTVETRIARDPEQAVAAARELGFPVALKILSPDVSHKSDVGGVALDLESEEAVREAAAAQRRRLAEHHAEATLEGFVVQCMARRPGAHELIVGVATDPVFGPVVLFGQGGTAVEVTRDRSVALPPLNLSLASALIGRTRVSRLLAGYRDQPAADLGAIGLTLVRISQLLVDLPELVELDVNPLLADAGGVLALDARLRARPDDGRRRLAIRPYPRELEETWSLRGGQKVVVRPIRPEDEPAHRRFLERLAPEDVYFRFFNMVRHFPHSQLARYTQIDYDREMAFIACAPEEEGRVETLGVVRAVAEPDNRYAEFAIIVRSDLKGEGLGHALLEKMIDYCRSRGTQELVGQVLAENRAMLSLAERLGFESRYDPDEGAVVVRLALQERRAKRSPRRARPRSARDRS